MSSKHPTFDHLKPALGQRANVDPSAPFAHLLGQPAAPTGGAPITSPTAAAIVAVGEHARRAQGGAE